MFLDRGQLKADAKAAMRGRSPSVYLVALVYLAVLYVLEMLTTRLQFPGVALEELLDVAAEEQARRILDAYLDGPGFPGELLRIAVSVMQMMLNVGFIAFCLNVSRGLAADAATLFDAFGNFFRFLGMNVLIGLIVSLWSLVFVVPGIIAAYRYSLANYILLDDPDKGPVQCMRESRELTMGWKGQLFLLDLSFLGWYLLTAIPFVGIYTLPYIQTAKANAYRSISGRWDAPVHVDYNV